MTVEAQVRAAKTPREALLILARAIDALQPRPASLDSWDGWNDDAQASITAAASAQQKATPAGLDRAPAQGSGGDRDPEPARLTEIDDADVKAWIARNYGREPEDDAEGRALIAQVRQDLLTAPNVKVVEDLFRTTTEGVIESDIDWSPLNDEHRAGRYQFAKVHLQLDVALGPHPEGGDWFADYASGGPMWFYIPNRDLVMQYPDNVRSAMVADVSLTSHARLEQAVADKVTNEFGGDVRKQPMSTDLEGGAPQPMGMREADL